MRARHQVVSAFTQGVTLPICCAPVEREFPEHRRRTPLRLHSLRLPPPRPMAAPLPSPAALAGQPASAPLTRVALASIEPCFAFLYLRFGEPARIIRLPRPLAALRRIPAERGSVPCPLAGQRLRHRAPAAYDDAGLHAARCGVRTSGVRRVRACCCTPRARTLCAPVGTYRRHRGTGIAPVAVSSRTGARLPTGLLRACRCPNTRAGTPPGSPGGQRHDRRFHCLHRAASRSPRARLQGRPVLEWSSAHGLAALAWASFSCICCCA